MYELLVLSKTPQGNNLRVKGADVLGKLLTCNKTLCR